MRFVQFLQQLPLWRLRLLAIFGAILGAELVVITMSLLLHGFIAYDYLLTGLVASGLVSYVTLSLMTLLLENLANSQLELYTIIETEPECVKLIDRSARLLRMNQAGLNMLQAEHIEQVVGHPVFGVLLPEYRQRFAESVQRVFEGCADNLEFEIEGLKGRRLWVNMHATPLRDTRGRVIAMLSVTRDITEQKKAEEKLRVAHRQTEALLNSMVEGVYGVNKIGLCTFVNQSFLTLLKYDHAEELLGKPMHALIHHTKTDGTPYPATECPLDFASQHNASINLSEETFWCKDGSALPVECWAHPLMDEQSVIGTIVTFIDIRDRKLAEQKIRRLAYYDSLTQLPNRRLLHDRLDQAMATSHRTHRYFALMFLDMDNFKSLNDHYGHDIGDLLLIEVARRINLCTRQMDTVARFGGDEFVVMIRELEIELETSALQAKIVAEKIRAALAEPYLLHMQIASDTQMDIQHHSTASIGIVMSSDQLATQDKLLKQADMAMYHAKEAGGNCMRFYHEHFLTEE